MSLIDQALAESKSDILAPKEDVNKPVDSFISEMKGFEKDRVEIAKGSAKLAWKIAMASLVIALLAVIAVISLAPLKETIPYVIKVNEISGQVEIAKSISDSENISYGEVMDKYWLTQFVIKRNSYNWQSIQSKYDAVQLMSSRDVFAQYNGFITSDNSPVNIFEDYLDIDVNVDGVTFVPVSDGSMIAQVHFERSVLSKDGSRSNEYQSSEWIATITWDYQAEISHENERMINPLGFRTTSYREDQIIK
ncbi:virB8 family protein [Enterovibrio calviensis]|uniref:virB8 family protein n=1 Tax=Enterovibrio calviensis TaxID=91359 RepID=UPI003736E641